MSGIRPLNSTGNDPYNISNVGTQSESLNQTSPVRPDLDANIQNQGTVGASDGVSEKQGVNPAEESQDKIAREKKGLQEMAAERIAEEQLKAQMKQTQLAEQLDASDDQNQAKEVSGSQDPNQKDQMYIDWGEENSQAVPFKRQDGSLQRWDVHDKAWE